MRNRYKSVVGLLITICLWSFFTNGEELPKKNVKKSDREALEVYSKLDFCEVGQLDFKLFALAYKGYNNLKKQGCLDTFKQLLSIADLSKSSNGYRFWMLDLVQGKVLCNTYVAHGQGSGEEFAELFSNSVNSHQSSIGFYVTGDTYYGRHGLSLYLHGLDEGYNDAAYERAIVMHGAPYVSNQFIQQNKRLGRSWGCPALPNDKIDEVVSLIKEGTCLLVYYPDSLYLMESKWVTNTDS